MALVQALGAAGCPVESLGLLEGGEWKMFINGAPAAANAAFPSVMRPLVGFFVRCGAPEAYPSEVQLTEADNGGVVKLAAGGGLTIALSSNPSTGFAWHLVQPVAPGLQLVGEPRFAPAGSTSPVPGAPGTEIFAFKASLTAAAPIVLTLEYRRGFELNVPPALVYRVVVEVR